MILPAALAFSACSQKIVFDVDYNVTLNPENTYVAGEPVRFDITGNVDNLLMYTGEIGSEYRYKDRYEVAIEDVKSATLDLEIKGNYGGTVGGLEVFVSNTFDGLAGDDAAKDVETIKTLSEGGMQGWTKLDYNEKPSDDNKWISVSSDITDVIANFAIAMHWNPSDKRPNGIVTNAKRTYRVNGQITIDLGTKEPQILTLKDFSYTSVMMNDWFETPYVHDAGNGSIKFLDSSAQIAFIGENMSVHDGVRLDGWVFSSPMAADAVPVLNDKPVVVKDMQNYISSYEYTWNDPGTYTVTFVGMNANYAGASKEIHEFKVTILAK